eukprot:COSAG01_NODE_52_length_31456_cov_125.226648_5_plen_374_part_00
MGYSYKRMKYKNLIDIIETQHINNKNKNALHYKINKKYKGISYAKLRVNIVHLSNYLKNIGLKDKDKVALLSNNRPEWVISDMAIQASKGIVVPIYPTLSKEEVAYIIIHSESVILIAELPNRDNLTAFLKKECKTLKHIINIKDLQKIFNNKNTQETEEENYNKRIKEINKTDIASIVYTSGTTGKPKGVQLSHGNFLSNIESITNKLPLTNNERVLSFLPLSHVFERTAGYYTLIALGGEIFYAENIESIGKNMIETKPTIVVSVPRLYEKIQNKILGNLKPINKIIFNWALKIGQKQRRKKDKTKIETALFKIADKLVFQKIQKKTGGNLKFFVSGGAPLNEKLGDFFLFIRDLDIRRLWDDRIFTRYSM